MDPKLKKPGPLRPSTKKNKRGEKKRKRKNNGLKVRIGKGIGKIQPKPLYFEEINGDGSHKTQGKKISKSPVV